jgi:hypothetical protein
MKPVASNVVANLLTRHVREAHANSLSSSQNVIQPTARSVQSPDNSEFCFFLGHDFSRAAKRSQKGVVLQPVPHFEPPGPALSIFSLLRKQLSPKSQ